MRIILNSNSILPILLAAIVQIVLGALWYSPLLFGKIWMKLTGLSRKDLQKAKQGMGKAYALAFVAAFVTSYVFAIIIAAMEVGTVGNGMLVGFFLWLGFIAPVHLGRVLWEGQSAKLYTLNIGYYLVSYLVVGAILSSYL